MKVLFVMRSTVYARNFESTLRLLAERGHDVHVIATPHTVLDPTNLLGRLSLEYPRIRHDAPPVPVGGDDVGVTLRRALDYLRYLEPLYHDAPKLRQRAEKKAPAFIQAALKHSALKGRTGRAVLRRVAQLCDHALPTEPAIDEFMRREQPDLVVVTPLVESGSPQSTYLRSARALGIPTALCVYSWDNLTNKGLIHDPLDVVTVWNRVMVDEAVTLHGVPRDRIVVTGAAPYDHWFEWRPHASREAFCARVGLDADRPYILYLCSSKFIAPDERPFVTKWVEEIRVSSSILRHAGVLVRPHPQNVKGWSGADLSGLGQVAVWPRSGANPADQASRTDYYDSIFHSAAVVGVNTSAQIESAIVGRGVFTVLAPEFRDTQDGTLHFKHLRDVNGGLLHIAPDLRTHCRQLEAALRDPATVAEKGRRFVEAFVRPHGIAVAATPLLVAALEETAARGARNRNRSPSWASFAKPLLRRVAKRLVAADMAHVARDEEPERAETGVASSPEPRVRRAKAGQGVASVEAATPPDAFESYVLARDCLRPLRDARLPQDATTASEDRLLAGLAGLWDARPDMVASLRRYCDEIGAGRAADYDAPDPSIKRRLNRNLRGLLAGDDTELWLDEPAALGGFGLRGRTGLFNEDTLRFFHVRRLLRDAAILPESGCGAPRQTVWEIGGGWGGFAYQLKTACPGVTYLITGHPDLLLVSAVYLMTLFPSAQFRFYEPSRPDAFWQDWQEVDFAFAPEYIVSTMRPPRLELTVDISMLERMSAERVDQHVRSAHAGHSRYFFSLCSAADSGTSQPLVLRAIDRMYWRHPVSAPGYVAQRVGCKGTAGRTVEESYLLGWRRLRV